jgi:type I restriction enzyme S subunit
LGEIDDGSPIPSTTRAAVYPRKVEVPPVPEQRAIAHILGTLDDKIELNRRMSATLEAMARAIFQDWFVAFGPTRAKTEGRPPYLAPELWSLFPDSLDAEGKPEGWENETLARVADLNPESWSSRTMPSAIEYLDLAGCKRGEIQELQTLAREAAPSRAQRVLRPGDTVVGTVRPGNRSFALIGRDGITGSTGFAVLRPKHAGYREFLYLAATADDAIAFLAHRADGAAYPAVRPAVVVGVPIVWASHSVLLAFSGLVAPLIDRTIANRAEAQTLAATRDLLLPRLMSGELRVKDAERFLERVV